MVSVCPNCQQSQFESDTSRGDTVCINCGVVVEENSIREETNFAENADGSASVVGQYVGGDGQVRHYMNGINIGNKPTARERARKIAEETLTALSNQMKIDPSVTPDAIRIYLMVHGKQLTRGRPTTHVIVACLYLACRIKRKPNLLIDFSDATQVNVFTLGKVYLFLLKELHIKLPGLDPVLYINKFANYLDFGDYNAPVIDLAQRLAKRMIRDWISYGRRPSGITAATIVLAGRFYGFNVDIDDMVKVAKIGSCTIRKRLQEFASTASSQLTINEFLSIDLSTEENPPIYKSKYDSIEKSENMEAIEEQINQLSVTIHERTFVPDGAAGKGTKKKKEKERLLSISEEEEQLDEIEVAQTFINSENPAEVAEKILAQKNKSTALSERDSDYDMVGPAGMELVSMEEPAAMQPSDEIMGLVSPTNNQPAEENTVADNNGELDLTDIDDREIELMLLTEREVEYKTKMWMQENGEYIKEKQIRDEKKQKDMESKKSRPKAKNKRERMKNVKEYYKNSPSAEEAIKRLINNKNLCSKIDYDALRKVTEKPAPETFQSQGASTFTPVSAQPSSSTSTMTTFNYRRPKKRVRPTSSLGYKRSRRSTTTSHTNNEQSSSCDEPKILSVESIAFKAPLPVSPLRDVKSEAELPPIEESDDDFDEDDEKEEDEPILGRSRRDSDCDIGLDPGDGELYEDENDDDDY